MSIGMTLNSTDPRTTCAQCLASMAPEEATPVDVEAQPFLLAPGETRRVWVCPRCAEEHQREEVRGE